MARIPGRTGRVDLGRVDVEQADDLAELDSFAASQPDSAYEIDVDFYRARALYELGDKDQARKLWKQIATNFPKSELARPSLEWAGKP